MFFFLTTIAIVGIFATHVKKIFVISIHYDITLILPISPFIYSTLHSMIIPYNPLMLQFC